LKPIRDVLVNEMIWPLYSLDGLHDINKTLTSMNESKGKQTEYPANQHLKSKLALIFAHSIYMFLGYEWVPD
jgi:hypothetical protein